MNVRAAEKINDVFGTVIPSTNTHENEGGNFVRIRVSMDITIPLCRGHLVSVEEIRKCGSTSNMNICQKKVDQILLSLTHSDHLSKNDSGLLLLWMF